MVNFFWLIFTFDIKALKSGSTGNDANMERFQDDYEGGNSTKPIKIKIKVIITLSYVISFNREKQFLKISALLQSVVIILS